MQLQPHRQYRINFWLKSEGLSGGTSPEVKVISADNGNTISYQTFHTDGTQDWKQYDVVFNSMDSSNAYAHAIENHCYLVTSAYDFRSFILEPMGQIVAEATAAHPIAFAKIALETLA